MAKKTVAEKKKKLNPIDNIVKFKTQLRSFPAPKRRSDFSSFFPCSCSSASSVSNLGSFGHALSSVTATSLNDSKDDGNVLPELPQLRCGKSVHKKSKPLSDFYDTPVIVVESVGQNMIVDNSGDSDKRRSMMMEFIPDKSRVTESNGVCATPGNVVWAKTNQQMWWPAEVIGETSSVADSRSQGIDGHVLVQFYGDHGSAWVHPAKDLSQLEDRFEERSCNSMDNFQNALKQALKRKEDLTSHRQLLRCSDRSDYSNQEDQSCDKWMSSSSISSRTQCDYTKRKNGKKKQKKSRLICFDDVVYPLTPARKVRPLRIMRYLGLIAPIGSPF